MAQSQRFIGHSQGDDDVVTLRLKVEEKCIELDARDALLVKAKKSMELMKNEVNRLQGIELQCNEWKMKTLSLETAKDLAESRNKDLQLELDLNAKRLQSAIEASRGISLDTIKMEDALRSKDEELGHMRAISDEQKAELSILRAKLAEAREKVESAEVSQQRELAEEVALLHVSLESERDHIKELENVVANREVAILQLRREIESSHRAQATFEDLKDALQRAEIDRNQAKLKNAEEVQALRTEVAEARNAASAVAVAQRRSECYRQALQLCWNSILRWEGAVAGALSQEILREPGDVSRETRGNSIGDLTSFLSSEATMGATNSPTTISGEEDERLAYDDVILVRRVAVRVERVAMLMERFGRINDAFKAQARRIFDKVQIEVDRAYQRIDDELVRVEALARKRDAVVSAMKIQARETQKFKDELRDESAARAKEAEARLIEFVTSLEQARLACRLAEDKATQVAEELSRTQADNKNLRADLEALGIIEEGMAELRERLIGQIQENAHRDSVIEELSAINKSLVEKDEHSSEAQEYLRAAIREKDEAVQALQREVDRLSARQIDPSLARSIQETETILLRGVMPPSAAPPHTNGSISAPVAGPNSPGHPVPPTVSSTTMARTTGTSSPGMDFSPNHPSQYGQGHPGSYPGNQAAPAPAAPSQEYMFPSRRGVMMQSSGFRDEVESPVPSHSHSHGSSYTARSQTAAAFISSYPARSSSSSLHNSHRDGAVGGDGSTNVVAGQRGNYHSRQLQRSPQSSSRHSENNDSDDQQGAVFPTPIYGKYISQVRGGAGTGGRDTTDAATGRGVRFTSGIGAMSSPSNYSRYSDSRAQLSLQSTNRTRQGGNNYTSYNGTPLSTSSPRLPPPSDSYVPPSHRPQQSADKQQWRTNTVLSDTNSDRSSRRLGVAQEVTSNRHDFRSKSARVHSLNNELQSLVSHLDGFESSPVALPPPTSNSTLKLSNGNARSVHMYDSH